MQEVQRRQRELDRPGAEVLPPREPLLARLVCLGHHARHRIAALRGVRLLRARVRVRVRVRVRARVRVRVMVRTDLLELRRAGGLVIITDY